MNGAAANHIISSLASSQHGVIARRQLRGRGLSVDVITTRILRGHILPIQPGVYAVGHSSISREAEALAAVLAAGPGAVASHSLAAELWGLSGTTSKPEVTRTSGARRRRHLHVHQTRKLPPEDVTVHRGVPLTSVPRTLLDMAPRFSEWQLSKAVAEAERMGLLDWDAMDDLLRRVRRKAGRGRLRWALERTDPRVGDTNPGTEELFLEVWKERELPLPEINVVVKGIEVDFLWREPMVIVECDGFEYHKGRTEFETDRRRDMNLRLAGYEVHRATHRMLTDLPERFVRTVHSSILDRSPPSEAMSGTSFGESSGSEGQVAAAE